MKDKNIKNTEIEQRNLTIDIMKGICIVLVVLGHTYNTYTTNFIYLFHVGVFFILSGYCFNQNYTNSLKDLWILFKKRVQSLWIPYVFYNLFFLLLQNIWIKIGLLTSDDNYFSYAPFLADGYSIPITLKDAIKAIIKSFFFMGTRPFAGALWFLGGLFYVTFIYAILQFIMRKLRIEKFHIIVSLLLLIGGWLLVKLGLNEKISLLKQIAIICISEILFCIGTYIKEEIRLPNFRISIYYACVVLFFVILYVLSSFGTISIGNVNIVNPLFYLISILSGGGLLLCFIKVLISLNINLLINILSYIGKKTIPILALHFLSFKIITFIQWKIYGGEKILLALFPVWKNSLIWSLAYLISGIIFPLLICFLFSRFRISKIFRF
ncbi:MAG: acyltransferase family protein [Treponema sp.]|nr:acyltransferase family protein [Treponema sp.]